MPDKILLVDDELYMLRLIEHHLSRAGYELIKARNTDEARAVMALEKPTLMVGDTKALESVSAIPAIRVTDEPLTDDGQKASGIVFHKPFSPTHLVAEVKKLMDSPSPEQIPL